MNEDISYDEWFYNFLQKVTELKYKGPVDKYSFESEYDDGKSPETSAEEFVAEMNKE